MNEFELSAEAKAARAEYNRKHTDKAKKAAYYKEWRKKNPDKVKASNKRYWEKYAARLRAERGAAANG